MYQHITQTPPNIRFILAEEPCRCTIHVKKIIRQIDAITGSNRDGEKEATHLDCSFELDLLGLIHYNNFI